LQKNVKARGVRFNKPGAVVGIKGGRSGVFYGWFVVEGRSGVRRTKQGPVSVRPVAARPFVSDTVKKAGTIERAMEAFSATTEKFLNDGAFRATCNNAFNFNPPHLFQTPLNRLQATGLASFLINDDHEAYAEIMYVRSDVFTQLASSGTFFNNYRVPVGNPYLPAAARQQLCARAGVAAADCVVGNPTEATVSLGRRFTDQQVMMSSNIGHNRLVHLITTGANGGCVSKAAQGQDSNFSRATANIDNH
jgi:hypothetical protein